MNFVYILYSKSLDKYYVGETIDIQDRIEQHNSGFYDSAFRKQARRIETHIKKMKSKTYIQNLIEYPEITIKLKNKYN